MHAPHLMSDPLRLAQYLHEEGARTWVAAKILVDQIAMTPDQADGGCPNPLELRVELHEQKHFQQRDRAAREHVRMRDLQKAAPHLKALVDQGRRFVVVGV